MQFRASLTIPTYNRASILRECILSAQKQTVPVEIIVLDDGSTDQTEEMMRTEFPEVRYQRFNGPNGPCFLRNRGAEMASCPILFPLDDDSVMISPHTVEQTLAELEHPRVGAVSIPYINVNQDQEIRGRAPSGDQIYVCPAFLGASYAIKRDVFLAYRGYREALFYMNEERDICNRMLDGGYIVRLGLADPLHHHASPIRNVWKQRMLERRNNLCQVYWDVPLPHAIYHLFGTVASGLLFGLKNECVSSTLAGYWNAPGHCWHTRSPRTPISSKTYLLMRKFSRVRVMPLAELEPQLPPLQPVLPFSHA